MYVEYTLYIQVETRKSVLRNSEPLQRRSDDLFAKFHFSETVEQAIVNFSPWALTEILKLRGGKCEETGDVTGENAEVSRLKNLKVEAAA